MFSCLVILVVFSRHGRAQDNPSEVTNVSAVVDTQKSIVLLNYEPLDTEQDTMQVILKVSSDSGQTYIFPVLLKDRNSILEELRSVIAEFYFRESYFDS